MAQANPNAAVRAANGFVGTTHILEVDDVTAVTVAAAVAEAQAEGFIVVAVDGVVSGSHIAVQGAAATPAIGGTTLIATFG
jgi:hypothetical protein